MVEIIQDFVPNWFKCSVFQRPLKSNIETKTLSENEATTMQ